MAADPTPVVWSVTSPAAILLIQAVFWIGWGLVLLSMFLLNHFELFGLRQVWGASARPRTAGAAVPHALPLQAYAPSADLGFLLAFWAAPTMTAGHLLFAVGTTGYILIGIWLEERDMIALFGGPVSSLSRAGLDADPAARPQGQRAAGGGKEHPRPAE